jgi:hypothetical protein
MQGKGGCLGITLCRSFHVIAHFCDSLPDLVSVLNVLAFPHNRITEGAATFAAQEGPRAR